MHKIYLSPSNQTSNLYATNNTNENAQCTRIANYCKEALNRCGFNVMVATISDTLVNRCKQSDKFNAELHVPIHTNASNTTVQGTRLFCYSFNDKSYTACKHIMATLAPITPGTSDNISVRTDLYEVRVPKAPTAYIECEFHDNVQSSSWIVNNTDKIGEKICEGICNYFNVPYIEEQEKLYRVQVGAFSVKENANALRDKLKSMGFDAFVTEAYL